MTHNVDRATDRSFFSAIPDMNSEHDAIWQCTAAGSIEHILLRIIMWQDTAV